MTDTPYIYSDTLPIWIVTISGWEDEGPSRMEAYLEVAKKWKINIEFSTRLGTLHSYKRAPTVQKEIMEHNENTKEVNDIFSQLTANNSEMTGSKGFLKT
jgi:hypothetical protein